MEEINVKEFGIYPTTREPQLWLGCRAIITNKTFDVPFDRWSESLRYKVGADDFISWVNHIAIPKIELCIKRGQKKFCFSSDNGFFTCEADDRDSGGYLYCGFYSTEKYDEMIKV